MIMFMSDTTHISATRSQWAVMLGTLVGFIMISIIVIVAAVLKAPLHKNMILLINVPAAFMFICTSIIIFMQHHNAQKSTGYLLVAGMFALMNCIAYCVDLWFTYKDELVQLMSPRRSEPEDFRSTSVER
jgi:ABC-type Fe3+-siderophore transport system permease subunit